MVQRKQPGKLSTPIETKKSFVKSDKRSTTNKPLVSSAYSSQNQDVRNKGGTDLKKKLKKSRSLKHLDLENIESSSPMKDKENLKNCIQSPAVDLLKTPTKSSSPATTKVSETSPNYMKSTSSSDARKERSPVSSSRSSQTVFDSRNQKRRNSNNSKSSSLFPSPYGEKPGRSLTKNNSLKPVRTLTKTTSTKAGKPKKSSTVVLNQNINMSRATCSSTLKDSKFPNYLMLNPGRSESEGTSVMKVCPYTYCSLNGHHHAPSPPLKCFLSAKRRLLRTQRSLRLKSLSPGGTKRPAKAKKETVSGQLEFEGDSSTIKTDSVQETGMGFFVEIYAKPRETVDRRSNHDGEAEQIYGATTTSEGQNGFSKSIRDGAEAEVNCDCCCIETNKSGSTVLVESESDEEVVQTSSELNWKEGEVVTQLFTEEVASPNLTNADMLQETSQESIEGSDTETADFESYEAYLILELDVCQDQLFLAEDTPEDQIHKDKESHLDHFFSGTISKSSVDKPCEELPAATGEKNGVSDVENDFFQENFQLGDHEVPSRAEVIEVNRNEEEENNCFEDDALIDHSSSSQIADPNAEIGQQPAPSEPYTELDVCQDQLSFAEDTAEEQIHTDKESHLDHCLSDTISESSVELPPATGEKNGVSDMENDFFRENFQLGDHEVPCRADVIDVNLNEEEKNSCYEDDALIDQSSSSQNTDLNAEIGQEPAPSEPYTELDVCQDQLSFAEDTAEEQIHTDKESHLDHCLSDTISESSVELPPATGEKNGVSDMENDFFRENFQLGDHEVPCRADVIDVNLNEEEKNSCYEDDARIDQSSSSQNTDLNAEIGQEPAPSEPYVDQLLPAADSEVGDEEEGPIAKINIEIEVSPTDTPQQDDKCGVNVEHPLLLKDQSSINSIAENKEHTNKDQGEKMDHNSAGFKHAEEHNDLENYNLNCIEPGMVENIQVQEQKVETDATETTPCKSNSDDSVGQKSIMKARKKSHPEVTEISCNNLKITIGCRKNFEESEELKDFNPRDPNYLPVEPEPEAETVDLKQQMMDERKNAEEWMVDFALRRAVTELAPARKRRVALLVEAFETVTPQTKRESLVQHVMPAFAHARPMQACI
ncbi:hypothetical protein MKW98_008976 [Papaver atlanticum]|uniref:Calmodulin-binding domain-containing protein n=1 Tax=Papaver atlanticum TaxID=357466 RepID=A0AAD4RXW2_9MAGN|nr:hypothetical protein MKW98_008976 [Papaver atlanticum]